MASKQCIIGEERGRRPSEGELRRWGTRIQAHARRLGRALPPMLSSADLEAAGWCGLLEVWKRHEGGECEHLDALLEQRIKGAMQDELRRVDTVSRGQRRVLRAGQRASADVEKRTGEGASVQARAEAAGVSHERLLRLEARAAERGTVSLGALELEVRDDAPDAERSVGDAQRKAQLREAVGTLPERHRAVLGLYYDEEQTLRQIAGQLGVSEARVCQLRSRALELLRVAMAA